MAGSRIDGRILGECRHNHSRSGASFVQRDIPLGNLLILLYIPVAKLTVVCYFTHSRNHGTAIFIFYDFLPLRSPRC